MNKIIKYFYGFLFLLPLILSGGAIYYRSTQDPAIFDIINKIFHVFVGVFASMCFVFLLIIVLSSTVKAIRYLLGIKMSIKYKTTGTDDSEE